MGFTLSNKERTSSDAGAAACADLGSSGLLDEQDASGQWLGIGHQPADGPSLVDQGAAGRMAPDATRPQPAWFVEQQAIEALRLVDPELGNCVRVLRRLGVEDDFDTLVESARREVADRKQRQRGGWWNPLRWARA